MNIELSYMIIFAVMFVIAILSVTRKMSLGIGIMGLLAAFGVGWYLSPYTEIVINPITNAIFYNGDWTLAAILGLTHLITMIIVCIIASYNLLKSGGKIVWA